MSFTDQKPFVATDKHCRQRWNGRQPGEDFRCAFCGHKFVQGDTVRWLYTNNLPNAGGNPFTCSECDGPDVLERWVSKCEHVRTFKSKHWWFFRE